MLRHQLIRHGGLLGVAAAAGHPRNVQEEDHDGRRGVVSTEEVEDRLPGGEAGDGVEPGELLPEY